jgi:hypothetical protein
MRSATLGFVLALGAAGAHAQTVVTRHVDNELVETVVTRTPTGTVITRRPLGAAPQLRTTTRTSRRVVHHAVHTARRAAAERSVTHTVRTTRRTASRRPLVLAPTQRQVIYRTLVQQQVVPAMPAQVVGPPSVPGYPPFPPPAYPAPAATTGYAVPTQVVEDDEDDYAAAPVAAAQVYPVGAVLPARVAVAPLPVRAAVAVPAAQPYSYATVDGRVLLVDPVSNTVVADITP